MPDPTATIALVRQRARRLHEAGKIGNGSLCTVLQLAEELEFYMERCESLTARLADLSEQLRGDEWE